MNSFTGGFPGHDLTFEPGEIHLWMADLDAAFPILGLLAGVLSAGEKKRAAAFRFDQHRRRFIAARAVLRHILAGYLRCTPASVAFSYGAHGKPALRNQPSQQYYFNLSHSEGFALYAVTIGCEVGIDVERIRTDVKIEDVAEANFTIGELRALRRLPADRQAVGFFNCWTRKEAYVKGRGAGLSLPLQAFEVSLATEDPAALLRTCDDSAAESIWTLSDIRLGPEFAAAVALQGKISKLSLREWKALPEPTSIGCGVRRGSIMNRYRQFALLAGSLCLWACAAAAPVDTPAPPAVKASAFGPEHNSKTMRFADLEILKKFEGPPQDSYDLGPGDAITVTVWSHPELSGKHTIGPDGRIQLPFVGSVKLAGLTATEAGESLTRAVSDDYKGPVTTVQIDQYSGNEVLVLGSVAKPGVVNLAGDPTLLEVLARAGKNDGTRCAVFRGGDRVVWLDLRPLLRGEDTFLNIRLHRNDVVYVPNPADQLIYVMGQVNKPGAYPLTPNMSFLEALNQAGGPIDNAQPSQIVLARPNSHLQKTINLKDIIHSKGEINYSLEEGDIIYVPKNGVAKVGYVLQQLAPLTQTALMGAAIF